MAAYAGSRGMSAKRSNKKQSGTPVFDPASTGSLNASETLKLLALPDTTLPQTPEELGLEALHRATFVQLPLGVGYATREGRFIWCNEAFEQLLGLRPGEYREKTIAELTHKADSHSNAELLRDLWAGRIKSYSVEKRYVKRDGNELWVRVSASCFVVKSLKRGSTSSITKASSLTIMQVAFSSVKCGLKVKPSRVKNSTDRFRSRTGRLTKILREVFACMVELDRPGRRESSVL